MTAIEEAGPNSPPALLPPKGMLIAFGLQIPLAIHGWPWHPSAVEALGGGLLLAVGSVLNLWASRRFTLHEVGICPFSAVPRLIEDGPYRFSRNPMYLGMVFLVAGSSLLTASPWNLWTAVAYAIWLHFRFILLEERFLAGLFGQTYTAYAKGRGRWLGWF